MLQTRRITGLDCLPRDVFRYRRLPKPVIKRETDKAVLILLDFDGEDILTWVPKEVLRFDRNMGLWIYEPYLKRRITSYKNGETDGGLIPAFG